MFGETEKINAFDFEASTIILGVFTDFYVIIENVEKDGC